MMIECIYDIRLYLSMAVIYLIYKLGTFRYNLHLRVGRKGPPPLPFIGNLIDIMRYGPYDMDIKFSKKYGKIYPFYLGNIPMIYISDEELLKQVMIREAKHFTDRMDFGFNGKLTEKMLTTLKGKDWERVRNLVSPTFTSGKLKKMFPLITECIDLLNKKLHQHPVDKPLDIKEYIGALTMDIIARTMFGMKVDSQTNPANPFIINAKLLFNSFQFNVLVVLLILIPKFEQIIRFLNPNWEFLDRNTLIFFTSNLQKAIDERKKSPEHYNDFLTEMMKAEKEMDPNDPDQLKNLDSKSLTNQEIIAQAFIFLIAGYETTAMNMTYVAYFLAMNQEAQREVYDEILDKIGTQENINCDTITNLPLLDAAINETLRMCVPISRLDRVCTENTVLVASDKTEIFVKKGDLLSIPVHAIHMNPSIWPNPQSYDIHRFDQENKNKHGPYSFLPFGLGPRNCVGMRFALLETKLALVNILIRFQFVPCAETVKKIVFKKTGLNTSVTPIILKIVRRNED